MRRIGLAVVLVVGLTVAPLCATAQPKGEVYRIGVLTLVSAPEFEEVFRQSLRTAATSRARISCWNGGEQRARQNGLRILPPTWSGDGLT